MTTHDRVRTVQSFKHCRTQWPSRALPSGHSTKKIANSVGQSFSHRFSLSKRVSQKRFAISVANKFRRAECRPAITFRRWKQKSIQSAAVGASTVKCSATSGALSSIMMSSGNTWFSSKCRSRRSRTRWRCLRIHAERGGPGPASSVRASHCRST